MSAVESNSHRSWSKKIIKETNILKLIPDLAPNMERRNNNLHHNKYKSKMKPEYQTFVEFKTNFTILFHFNLQHYNHFLYIMR